MNIEETRRHVEEIQRIEAMFNQEIGAKSISDAIEKSKDEKAKKQIKNKSWHYEVGTNTPPYFYFRVKAGDFIRVILIEEIYEGKFMYICYTDSKISEIYSYSKKLNNKKDFLTLILNEKE